MVSVWVEKQRQKILKELGASADGKEIGEDVVLAELRKVVESELRLNYLITGSKVFLALQIPGDSTNCFMQMVIEG